MATFVAVTASSTPLVTDLESVKKVMERYCWDSDVEPVIQADDKDRSPRLAIQGYDWPRAWRIPDGMSADDFEPDYDSDSDEALEDFLKQVAPFLAEPLVVQSVGFEDLRFPVAACEWCIAPAGTEIELNAFKHSLPEPTILGADPLA